MRSRKPEFRSSGIRDLRAVAVLAAFLSAPSCLGHWLQYDAAYHHFAYQRDHFAPSLQYRVPLADRFGLRLGARLALSESVLQRWDAVGELGYRVFPWLIPSFRLSHAVLLPDTAGHTDLMLRLRLQTPGRFSAYGTVGWYKRFSRLREVVPLPLPWNVSATDQDWVIALGGRMQVNERHGVWVGIATFDSLEVFRLNNAAFEGGYTYRTAAGAEWRLRLRYRVLLGFGRLDELLVRTSLRLPLEKAAGS